MSFHPSLELNHSMSNRIMMFLMFASLFCNVLTSFRIGKAKMAPKIHPLSYTFDVFVFVCKYDSDNPLQRV